MGLRQCPQFRQTFWFFSSILLDSLGILSGVRKGYIPGDRIFLREGYAGWRILEKASGDFKWNFDGVGTKT